MNLDDVAAALAARLPGAVERDVPVSGLTTYRLGGPVAILVRVATEEDVLTLADVIGTPPEECAVPVLVIGRGSNLLVADRGFAGVAVVLGGVFEAVELRPDDGVVRAGAGVPLPVVARRAAAAGLAGLEFYVGIPGSVGGAVRMNAGGHGRETHEVLREAQLIDLRTAQRRACTPEELGLAYRHSGVGDRDVVLAAEFQAVADDPDACSARIDEVVRWRRAHQPGGSNAGSVFRNPPDDSAGRLVDACGLKGLRVGGAHVSRKHANFFQADRTATANDVRSLVEEVQRRVADATGVRLVAELHMVGFDRDDREGRDEG